MLKTTVYKHRCYLAKSAGVVNNEGDGMVRLSAVCGHQALKVGLGGRGQVHRLNRYSHVGRGHFTGLGLNIILYTELDS